MPLSNEASKSFVEKGRRQACYTIENYFDLLPSVNGG